MMKELQHKGIFLIRYGISIALLILLVMVYILMNHINIRQVTKVELIRIDSISYVGIIQSTVNLNADEGEVLMIGIDKDPIPFRLDQFHADSKTLYLSLEDPASLGTYPVDKPLQGRIYGDTVRLQDLIFNWKNIGF